MPFSDCELSTVCIIKNKVHMLLSFM